MSEMTFLINDSSTGGNTPVVQVTITENADGTLTFVLTQLAGYVGDLRGLFFDVADELLIGSLSATGDGLTEMQQGDDTIDDLGGGANMNGLLGDSGGYDVGVEIGSSGLKTNDDIRTFTFTLDSSLRDLSLADFSSVSFGARVTSVGLDSNLDGSFETSRTLSSKTGEVTFAVISPTKDEAAVTEDATTTGNVLSNDGAGAGDVLTVTGWSGGALGTPYSFVELQYATITLNANGSYAIDASAADALAAGESVSHTFTYDVLQTNIDGISSHTVSFKVTITGTNDTPVIAGETFAAGVDELGSNVDTGTIATNGTLTFDDVDLTDEHTVEFAAVGPTLGTLTALAISDAATGAGDGTVSWTYSVDAANVAYLAEGETRVEEFTVVVKDDDGTPLSDSATVKVTITGSNDVATVGGTATGEVSEDGTLQVSDSLTVSDADAGQAAFQVQTDVAGEYGSFSIDATGLWTYNLDNAAANVQALDTNDTLTDAFTVNSQDGSASQIVTVTINGLDDNLAPVAVDDVVAETVEALVATLTFESGTFTQTYDYATGQYVYITNDGYKFANNGAGYFQGNYVEGPSTTGYWGADYSNALYSYGYKYSGDAGDPTLVSVMPIEMTRVDGGVFSFDAANITSYNYSYYYDPAATFTETVTGYLDGVQVAQQTFSVPEANSGIRNNVVDITDPGFASVDRVEYALTADYSSNDYYNHGYQWIDNVDVINYLVGPTEDSPVIGIDVLGNDTDDGAHSALSIAAFSATSALGAAVTLNLDGTSFNYDPTGASALQALSAGEVLEDTFTYAIEDAFGAISNTATVTVSVHGRNDAPVASNISGAADEDGPAITMAAIYTDHDALDTHTISLDLSGTQGQVSYQGSGNFSYDASSSSVFNQLAAGETALDTFHYTVTDSHGTSSVASATVTVTGENDAPVASNDFAGAATLTFEYGTFTQTYDYATGQYVYITNDGYKFANNGAGYFQGNYVEGPYTTSYWGADYSNALYSYGYKYSGDAGDPTLVNVMPIEMTRVDGGVFSFDAANITSYNNSYYYDPAATFTETVTGYLGGVQVAQQTFSVPDANSGMRNNVLDITDPGFASVDRVEYALTADYSSNDYYNHGYQWIDNVQVSLPASVFDIDVLHNDSDVDHGSVLAVAQFDAQSAQGVSITLNPDGTLHYDATDSAAWRSASADQIFTDTFSYRLSDEHGALSNTATVTVTLPGIIGDNTISGGDGNDTLNGGYGNDTLDGGNGDDILLGGQGMDRLIGGPGSDTMTGGGAGDTFVFSEVGAADVVTDFSRGEGGDVLDLNVLLGTFTGIAGDHSDAFSGGYLQFVDSGGSTLVQIDNDGGGDAWTTLATLTSVVLLPTDVANFVL